VTRAPMLRDATLARLRRWLGCIALLGLFAHGLAGAAALAEPDAGAVRRVVEAQLEAFAADDPERAYTFASAGIQARFGNATAFMAMVRGGYPMLVRPSAVTFFRAEAPDDAQPTPATALQVVQVRDRAGRLWRATYLLERQADAGWRIGGCVVAAESEKSMT
jgi:Domain of unknown function (DUF4864)